MTAIALENVHLHYSAAAFAERSIKAWLLGLASRRAAPVRHDIHALRGISARIAPGERVALIGRNGAGKSTFLKAVAGLYPISGGALRAQGEIAAMFELGLGFEPEATGRENILYRGLLTGLSPKEIRALEDDIVAFADIGEFIDYPLKAYSSGMLARLAFSISMNVSADIVLIDEFFGAGDAGFVRRASERMIALSGEQRILIVASHNLTFLADLCTRGIFLHHGAIVHDGPIKDAVAAYRAAQEAR